MIVNSLRDFGSDRSVGQKCESLYAPARFLAEASTRGRNDAAAVLVVQAGSTAMEPDISVYDALYLALVERTDAPLVSDDCTFIAAGKRSARRGRKVVWIGDFVA